MGVGKTEGEYGLPTRGACRLGGYRALAYSCRRVVAYVAWVAQKLYGRGMPRPVDEPNFFGEKRLLLFWSRSCCTVAACRAPLVSLSFSVKEDYFCFGSVEVVRSRHAATR